MGYGPQVSHTIELTPAPEDIDDLDHVSNLVYARWILEVALAHSAAVGWDNAAYRRLGAIWVVRRHEIDYLQSVVLGDRVAVTTWVEAVKGVSSIRKTSMRRMRDNVEVCRASSTWAFIDLATGKPRRISDDVRNAFPILTTAPAA
jgi:acyl-CoA thioester hydrolase